MGELVTGYVFTVKIDNRKTTHEIRGMILIKFKCVMEDVQSISYFYVVLC